MSNKFRIGDKIRVISDFNSWLDQGSERDQIFTVVEDNNNPNHVFCPQTNTCDIDHIREWPNDFEIVNTLFSVDLAPEVALNYASGGFTSKPFDGNVLGQLGSGLDREVITSLVLNETTTKPFELNTDADGKTYLSGIGLGIATPNFTKLPHPLPGAIGIPPQEVATLPAKPDLGVYRPNLEDRKVGKVPMHMITDGFPHALQHIAEIMGWAAETKGYKLHDWKNLPNADIEFPSAADRHGNDNSKQKSKGLSALERVDHESSKLHIGHKVFNLLAELELVLTGKIK